MSDPVLYIVATPIGNLADMTSRAIAVLTKVDFIAAEDTRHTSRLLQHFNISSRLISFHKFNETERVQFFLEKLAQKHSIALVSDAGTPLISDPGFVLVKAVRDAGYTVIPIPGPCAMIAALSASGIPADRFIFCGFLPHRISARQHALQEIQSVKETVIYYESKHRILETLALMLAILGKDREVCIAREMTKTFETFLHGSIETVHEKVSQDEQQRKGEFVIVIKGVKLERSSSEAIDAHSRQVLALLAEELPPKKAASLAAKITGADKKLLYDWLVKEVKH